MSDRHDVLLQTISDRNSQIRDLLADNTRLRMVVEDVRALLKDDAALGYPVVDYIALEAVLAQLDVSGEATDG